MPVMDGFELIAEIRATPALQGVPIVVLTTRGSEADRQRAAALGADAYLVKAEFGEEAFTAAISRFLGGRPEAP
jgi:CheY-like chemotaxis protein